MKTLELLRALIKVNGYPGYWGWALKPGSKKRELKFSHFVLVATAPDNLDVDAYYVIKVRDLKYFPKNFAQFKNVEKGFGVFPKDLPANAPKGDLEYVRKSKNLLKANKAVKVLQNESLSEALRK